MLLSVHHLYLMRNLDLFNVIAHRLRATSSLRGLKGAGCYLLLQGLDLSVNAVSLRFQVLYDFVLFFELRCKLLLEVLRLLRDLGLLVIDLLYVLLYFELQVNYLSLHLLVLLLIALLFT